MRFPRVALVTAAQALGLDDDAPVLLDALAACGVTADVVVWDDPAVAWAVWDLAVLRSTWDYPRRRDHFVAWAHHVGRVSALLNSPAVVTWNSDKRYLAQLAAAGVATVPSTLYAPDQHVRFPAAGPFVLKPAVSAGSLDTARYTADQHDRARRHARALQQAGRHVLVQPYVEGVDEHGETGLVYMADRYSHAIRKGPILAATTKTVGGLFAREDITPRTPSPAEHAAAEAALDALPFARNELLYARVDLVPGADGTPLLLEVELVEPSLFLRFDDAAAGRLAAAIMQRLASHAG